MSVREKEGTRAFFLFSKSISFQGILMLNVLIPHYVFCKVTLKRVLPEENGGLLFIPAVGANANGVSCEAEAQGLRKWQPLPLADLPTDALLRKLISSGVISR
ncbi:hypothetical protein CDAR_449811 [Caerostris darwini]|uniref:Uncharacterized protein n=1 Tax=Caerostris darwini TaxID=1538125 RepID=A0AAV4QS06_9ARAC|nr:hypothetical protein CDAR_449811 [Caerostris darwini]